MNRLNIFATAALFGAVLLAPRPERDDRQKLRNSKIAEHRD
jgi:hypothetical protein